MRTLSTAQEPTIALVQEPYINKGQLEPHPGNLRVMLPRNEPAPRAAIIAPINLSIWQDAALGNRDTVVATFNGTPEIAGNKHREYQVISMYLPYDSLERAPGNALSNIVRDLQALGNSIIIGGDANAHHVEWGSTDINPRGEQLLDWIGASNLTLLNEGNTPTFMTQNRSEVIDISLCSMDILGQTEGWDVMSDESFSDHAIIRWHMMLAPKIIPITYRNPKKADWERYVEILEAELRDFNREPITSREELEGRTAELTRVLQKAFDKVCPLRTFAPKSDQYTPWWNKKLANLRKVAKRRFNYYRRNPSEETYKEMRLARQEFRRELNRAKRQCWVDYCSGINSMRDTTRLIKLLKRDKRTKLTHLQTDEGTIVTKPEELLTTLLDNFFPSNPNPMDLGEETFDLPMIHEIITTPRIGHAVRAFQPFKQPGKDGIYPILLQKGLDHIEQPLAEIFRASLTFGHIPELWRTARVAFLPKPGKSTYNSPSAFRPICMVSFMLKVLEKLIYWFLEERYLEGNPIHRNQWAFRPGGGTIPPLHRVVQVIEKAFQLHESVLAVFLDIKGAFDNITTKAIHDAMNNRGWPRVIVYWIIKMLITRQVEAELEGESMSRPVGNGTSQGGVLSTIIWNVSMDPLLQTLEATLPQLFDPAFADDLALLQSGRDLDIMQSLMQQALDIVVAWADGSGLTISVEKSQIVIFQKTGMPKLSKPLFLKEEPIKMVTSAKYLGLWLDSKLTWKAHCDYLAKKATAILFQIRRAFGNTWGLAPNRMNWVYKAIILPTITYAAPIWIPAMGKITFMNKLRGVQRLAALMTTSAYPSTSTNSLLALLAWPDISLELSRAAAREVTRLSNLGLWGVKNPLGWENKSSHLYQMRKILNGLSPELLQKNLDIQIPALNLGRPDIIVEDSKEKALAHFQLIQGGNEALHIFTDGSKFEGGSAGAAFFQKAALTLGIPQRQGSYRLGTENSVFQAELFALRMALNNILVEGHLWKNIHIWTDSKSALQSLSQTRIKSKLTQEILNDLYTVALGNKIQLHWIPGHWEIPGNEIADQLAKAATDLPNAAAGCPYAPFSHFKNLINKGIRDQANSKWINGNDSRETRSNLPNIDRKVSKALVRLPRQDIGKIIQVLTGHSTLNSHQFRCRNSNTPNCPLCGGLERESVQHFLAHCPALQHHRCAIWGAFYMAKIELIAANFGKIRAFLNRTHRI